ncbi:hypothetical protein, partial [Providencia rustigianii]|uniref:hypothetical protein n=1 Tax=Providencia rustigianii TaxID=158850 RepID=UPI00224018EE
FFYRILVFDVSYSLKIHHRYSETINFVTVLNYSVYFFYFWINWREGGVFLVNNIVEVRCT